jgi:sugar phosphate isomerase/epimerase
MEKACMKPRLKNLKIILQFLFGLFFIIILFSCTQKNSDKNDVTGESGRNEIHPQRPSWLDNEPIVYVGNWDNILTFFRRTGEAPLWAEDGMYQEYTEETVRKLKDAGITLAIIHFYKGFGLEAEKDHMSHAKRLALLLKKYGIRVGVYVGSTIAYETFLLEKPEAIDWLVPDYLGQPVFYGNMQTFRRRVYFMHPGYKKYIKNVLRIAVEEYKADLIHFDNTSQQAKIEVFFHPLAIEDFRTFLKNKYSSHMLMQRFGFEDLTYVVPPRYTKPIYTLNDPLFQEWTDFRCEQLADYYKEMREYVRSLNPEVAIENNPHSGMSGKNTIWEQGVDYPRLLSNTDMVWTEEDEAGVTKEGILISKIRSYKMAQIMNNKIFTYTYHSTLQMAESMAYNRGCLGLVGPVAADLKLPEERQEYIKFFHQNFDYYHDFYNVADVAVLHTFASMGFNNDRPQQSTILFEQALIQAKIPFQIIFDKNLKDLTKYKVLVLADQECLSDEQLDLIRKFVKQGGGLVVTENTSLYNEWRRRRRAFGLNDLLAIAAPEWIDDETPSSLLNIDIVKKQIDKGRVVYIPEIKPVIEKPPVVAMSQEYWRLPLNWQDLISSVKWVMNDDLSVEVTAPLAVTIELTQKMNNNHIMLHLLNYNIEKNPVIKNCRVSLKIPDGKQVEKVEVLSPDREQIITLKYKSVKNRIHFQIPRLEIYNMVVVKLQ